MEEQKQTEEPKIKKAKVVKVSAARKAQFREILSNVFAGAHTDTINYPDLIDKINRRVGFTVFICLENFSGSFGSR